MPQPKVRTKYQKHEPYPLNDPTHNVIHGLCKRFVHRLAVGHADLGGNDFSRIFAEAIGGDQFAQAVGVADVAWNGCAWSVKTVKAAYPFQTTSIRLISGRNSPTYSHGIENPLEDPQKTGEAVLEIYNARIDEAREQHDDIRLVVMIRNWEALEFVLFERPLVPVVVNEYQWAVNERNNLIGYVTDPQVKAFTWQPHGSQFTVHEPVPHATAEFRLRKEPSMLTMADVLGFVKFKPSWIDIL